MNKEIVQQIINDVYPKIVNHYGKHNGYEVPKVEVHTNIFARISGIDEMEGDSCPSGEFCKDENKIFIYYPNVNSEEDVLKALIHEYTHYTQDSDLIKHFRSIYSYDQNPNEIEASSNESKWQLFSKK